MSSTVLQVRVEQASKIAALTERPWQGLGEERLQIQQKVLSSLGISPKGKQQITLSGQIVIRPIGRLVVIFIVITPRLALDGS